MKRMRYFLTLAGLNLITSFANSIILSLSDKVVIFNLLSITLYTGFILFMVMIFRLRSIDAGNEKVWVAYAVFAGLSYVGILLANVKFHTGYELPSVIGTIQALLVIPIGICFFANIIYLFKPSKKEL